MAAIKKFFQKRKLDIKFKTAGGAHKLTDETRSQSVSHAAQAGPSVCRSAGPSQERVRAAEAALSRSAQCQSGTKRTGADAVRAQVRQEIEAQRLTEERAYRESATFRGPQEVELDAAPILSVSGVYFHCPLIGDEVLPRDEMEARIHEFLLTQLGEEPQMTSALMIHTLNKSPDKVTVAIETLCKYMDNLINGQGQEKFRKIRVNNKAFQERVASLQGTEEFLQAAGFEHKLLPGPNDVGEDFLVIDEVNALDMERLENLKSVLHIAEPIRPELDRNMHVFNPSSKASRIEVPKEFYNVTPEELKKEQQIKQEAIEMMGMLRTKEMRERERVKELRRYRYTLLRFRFPDGILLQGTFRAQDKFTSVKEYVRENLAVDWIPFSLSIQTGQKMTEETQSLAELGLAPAAILNFAFDQTVLKEMAAQRGNMKIDQYLKAEVLSLLESL